MSAEEPSHLPGPLDALVAAPEHHFLLLDNDAVRVVETRIPAGVTVPLHTHCWPGTLYILSWSDVVRRDEHGAVVMDSRLLGRLPEGSAHWSGPLPLHTLENVGDAELLIISVEVKRCG